MQKTVHILYHLQHTTLYITMYVKHVFVIFYESSFNLNKKKIQNICFAFLNFLLVCLFVCLFPIKTSKRLNRSGPNDLWQLTWHQDRIMVNNEKFWLPQLHNFLLKIRFCKKKTMKNGTFKCNSFRLKLLIEKETQKSSNII